MNKLNWLCLCFIIAFLFTIFYIIVSTINSLEPTEYNPAYLIELVRSELNCDKI